MTTYAVEQGRRAWETLPRLRAFFEDVRPAKLLVPAIAIQWLTTLGLALTVRHNGWLYYQGGDQLWYYVRAGCSCTARSRLRSSATGGPRSSRRSPRSPARPLCPRCPDRAVERARARPVALLCVYGIAKRIGGPLFAYWAVLLWVTVPFIGIKFTDYLTTSATPS